jgi:hypothetical protein
MPHVRISRRSLITTTAALLAPFPAVPEQLNLDPAFLAQIHADTAFAKTKIPEIPYGEWDERSDWTPDDRKESVYALVHMSEGLLLLAVDTWASWQGNKTTADKNAALVQLRAKFQRTQRAMLPSGGKAYLSIVVRGLVSVGARSFTAKYPAVYINERTISSSARAFRFA